MRSIRCAWAWSLTVVALLLVSAPAVEAAQARKTPPAVTRAVQRLRADIRHVKLPARARRQDAALAARAARLFKRRRYCAGLDLIGRIHRVGRVGRDVRAVEAAVARARLARSCQIKTGTAGLRSTVVSGGGFPPGPIQTPTEEVNEQGDRLPPLPEGPFRPGLKTGTPTTTGLEPQAAGAGLGPAAAHGAAVTDPVEMFMRTGFGPQSLPIAYFADTSSDWGPPDPAEASAGNVVLVAVNTKLAYSTDGGKTFKYVDPATIFANQPDGGICCDMQLGYDPKVDRFFWLLQYWCGPGPIDCSQSATSGNRYRLALASPAQVAASGATAWKYFDFTPKTFEEVGQWFDFPDMALGANSLYFTFNEPRKSSAIWARISMADLTNLGSVGFQYLKWTGAYVLAPVQNTGTRGWVARRKDSSTFELVHWDDGSGYVYPHTVPFKTPPTKNCSQTGADGVNFLSMFDCAGFSQYVSGAAQRSNGDIWLAWSAGRRVAGAASDLFPHSNIQLLTVNSSTLAVTRQRAIWNPDYAFAYPELSASAGGEVAMSFVVGGGPIAHPSFGVAFVTNTESFRLVANGSADRSRIGDYYAVRPAYPSSKLFAAAGYVLAPAAPGTKPIPVYPWWTLFGRSGDKPILLNEPPLVLPQPPAPQEPPPSPPPPQPATSSMTMRCPTTAKVGTTLTIYGHLDPVQAGAAISVTYQRPALGNLAQTATTNASGDWSDSTTAAREAQGQWTITAHYAGDASHTAADASCQVDVTRRKR